MKAVPLLDQYMYVDELYGYGRKIGRLTGWHGGMSEGYTFRTLRDMTHDRFRTHLFHDEVSMPCRLGL